MEPHDHERFVAVWQPKSGIALHNLKNGVFYLFVCLSHNPYWSVLLRHTQGTLVTVIVSDFTLGYSTIVYLIFLFPTIPLPVLTHNS